jgi:hypothetical protein
MPDYQKGKIYRIISPSKNLVYYGSTIQTLNQRLAEHIKRYKYYNDVNYQKRKEYCKSYIVLECEDYKIELVEEYPCNNRQQLLRKEGEYMKNNTCVNTTIAGRTDKEYYDDNREKLIQRTKDWYEENYDDFWVVLVYDNDDSGDAGYGANVEKYNVFFDSFDFTVTKRGQFNDLWDVSIDLVEV